LKAVHQKSTTRLAEQTERVDSLENELARAKNNYKMFLTGAGILVLGLIIGVLTRPKKKRSSLL